MKVTKKSRMKKILNKIKLFTQTLVNKVIPPYEPRINIEEKLIPDEIAIDNALIRHFSELQIIIGFIIFMLSFLLVNLYGPIFYLFLILAIILIFTAFDIEEIYVTSKRLIIRRISFVERITRIPSDEEHLLEHVVSFIVGRAPMNTVLVFFGVSGLAIIIFSTQLSFFIVLSITLASLIILYIGLRLGKKLLTINLAGGHVVVLGIRKGIPDHIILSMSETIYQDPELPAKSIP